MASIFSLDGIDDALDKAITLPGERVRDNVAQLRLDHPHDTPAEIIHRLEKQLLRKSKLTGAGVGVAAAVPSVGTVTAMALTGAQLAGFVAAATMHVLAVAEIHGVPTDDIDRRRTLVLTTLLGHDGANAVQSSLGLSSIHWARQAFTRLPTSTVKAVNKKLRKRAAKQAAKKGGSVAFGRLMPFGIGAAIGWVSGKAMARTVIDGARTAFGNPPAAFASEAKPRAITVASGDR
ncbi:MAG: hypothetical protein Q4Q03_04885 [Bowdeniella nasicola]|nr:hypothetical protein [Bowdeniella nasicola]